MQFLNLAQIGPLLLLTFSIAPVAGLQDSAAESRGMATPTSDY